MKEGTLLDGRYTVLRLLAEGGMSRVYEVSDARLPGRLVVKVLRETDQPEVAAHFTREAEILASLKHPNLPRVHDAFLYEGQRCLVMELVEGHTLETVELPVDEARLRQWGAELCGALAFLHEQGLVYRDLKPSNVMLSGDKLVLIDFGIARFYQPGKIRDTLIMGSPGYAAPEQYGTEQTGPRADLYSLGALLHHLGTGHEPHLTPFRFPPARTLNGKLSLDLENVLKRALTLEPEGRYPDAGAMRAALLRQEAGEEAFLYPVEEPEARHYLATLALATGVTLLCCWHAARPIALLALGFLPLWAWLLAVAWRTSRERARARWLAGEEELWGPGLRVPWSEVQELTTGRHGLFAERRATVRTARGEGQFVLEDARVPAWSPGRGLGRARRLCGLIVTRAGLAAEPGAERFSK